MDTGERLDDIRGEALRRIDRAERYFSLSLVLFALVEALGLVGFIYFLDFGDRLHKLLMMQTVLVYGTLSIGLLSLSIFQRDRTLRVLKAIELLSEQMESKS